MSKEIGNKVYDILQAIGAAYVTTYCGATKRDDWECDAWRCTFTTRDGKTSESFDYFTGLGHRAPATPEQKQSAERGFQGLSANDKAGRTSYGRRYLAEVEKLCKPQAPHPADVLHSLLLVSDVVGQSFASWCDDLGMDSDSRKAYATYEACQENADKLARVFDSTTRAALREALEEY